MSTTTAPVAPAGGRAVIAPTPAELFATPARGTFTNERERYVQDEWIVTGTAPDGFREKVLLRTSWDEVTQCYDAKVYRVATDGPRVTQEGEPGVDGLRTVQYLTSSCTSPLFGQRATFDAADLARLHSSHVASASALASAYVPAHFTTRQHIVIR